MDMESALLRALHDDPADPTPYLVLADWFEDQGQSRRAELLRLRVGLSTEGLTDRRREWEARTRQLLAESTPPCVPTLVNCLGMTLALIPAGQFMMGSPRDEPGRYSDEDPWHRVEITRPYYLGTTMVTQAQYFQLIGSQPSHFSPTGDGKGRVHGMNTSRFPVENVSWEDAVAFCKRLSEHKEEKEAGRTYCLPTEAEWEYACRAGIRADPFYLGSALSSFDANIDGNQPHGGASTGPFLGRTCAVASYKPNAWGLLDLHGNVWEWCSDWYDASYYQRSPVRDPAGPQATEDGYRSIRGGSWNFRAATSRIAYRLRLNPGVRTYDVGFRVLCRVTKT